MQKMVTEPCDALCELQLDIGNLVPQLRAGYAVILLSLVILYYDYVLTLPREIELYWSFQQPLGWASSIFLVNRYLTVFGHIPVAIELFLNYKQTKTCLAIQNYHNYYIVVLQLLVAFLCFFRIYALYDRSVAVIWFFVLLGVGAFALGTWSNLAAGKKGLHSGLPHILPIDLEGCHSLTPDAVGKQLALAWTGVLVIDCAVFFMTLYRARRIQVQGRLLYVLVRDGAMYFFALFLTNLSNVLLFLFGPPASKGTLAIFTNVLSATLINRLMLSLRETSAPHDRTTDDASRFEQRSGERPNARDASAAPFSTVLAGPGMGYSVYAVGQDEFHGAHEEEEQACVGENAHGIELVPVRREPP